MRLGQPRARLGTQVSTMTSALRTFFGAPEDAGLLVQHVEPGSAAEAAKVQVGDVLLEVDGQRIVHAADVRDALADRRKGDVVDVVVVRGKQRKTLKATLTTEVDGPAVLAIPSMPELHFELPPAARRLMDPEAQQQLERELDGVREQLRAVERELEALRGSGAMRAPAPPPEPPTPPRGKAKAKRSKPR
jgi:membrane-associated protease RseP (regulator of RpoE activity)